MTQTCPYTIQWTADTPIVATAIHDGHDIRDDLRPFLALDEAGRLREEDPFTGRWAQVAPNSIVAHRSRFEVDMNRPRDKAIYRTPDDAWGLTVWHTPLPDEQVATSLALYDSFYNDVRTAYANLLATHPRIIVLDLHTYCHRRAGPDAPPADPQANPDINVGTGTMTAPHRTLWTPVVEGYMQHIQQAMETSTGNRLDIRENIKFYGGNFAAWTHATFADRVCVLSIEVKKFFVDEWTGVPDEDQVSAIGNALADTIPVLLDRLTHIPRPGTE